MQIFCFNDYFGANVIADTQFGGSRAGADVLQEKNKVGFSGMQLYNRYCSITWFRLYLS